MHAPKKAPGGMFRSGAFPLEGCFFGKIGKTRKFRQL
jgi:hypothetical protein